MEEKKMECTKVTKQRNKSKEWKIGWDLMGGNKIKCSRYLFQLLECDPNSGIQEKYHYLAMSSNTEHY